MKVRAAVVALVVGAVLLPSPVLAQFRLELITDLRGLDPVQPVMDLDWDPESGVAPNPFEYDCVANLQVVDGGGGVRSLVEGRRTERGVTLRVLGSGQVLAPRHVAVLGQGRTLQVLIPEPDAGALYMVRLEDAAVVIGGQVVDAGTLETEPFAIPEEAVAECGSIPRTRVEFQDRTEDEGGTALRLDVARRGPLQERRGMWELGVLGTAATAGGEALLDQWQARGRFDVLLTGGYRHWISLGGFVRVESTEDLETVDRVLGASLRARLDFIPLARIVRPLLGGFTPHPMLQIDYDHVSRVARPEGGSVDTAPPATDRVVGRLDWTVPLLLDARLRLRWEGMYRFDPAPGFDEWTSLQDISLEYPVVEGGGVDAVAILTWLDGETAPAFRPVSEYLLGLGLRWN